VCLRVFFGTLLLPFIFWDNTLAFDISFGVENVRFFFFSFFYFLLSIFVFFGYVLEERRVSEGLFLLGLARVDINCVHVIYRGCLLLLLCRRCCSLMFY